MIRNSATYEDQANPLPPPIVFGAPPHFTKWRALQSRAITAAMESSKRFVLQSAPTGFGKSLVYMGQALVSGARTIILTSTKGLQSQLLTDFAQSGLVDIRGMNSYVCTAAELEFGVGIAHAHKSVHCHEGPCHAGLPCSIKDNGCHYYDAYRQASAAQLVVSNYAYWMTINKYGEGLGKFDLMVLDEGHNAPDELSDFLSIELGPDEVEGTLGAHLMAEGTDMSGWRQWAGHHAEKCRIRYDRIVLAMRNSRDSGERVKYSALHEIRAIKQLTNKLQALAETKGDWVAEHINRGRSIKFDPTWPAQYSEKCLFRGTPKVVVFSATLRPKTAQVLGLNPSDYEFLEYPSSFPVERRPVYHIPTCQLNHRATDDHIRLWLTRIDQLVGARRDRKGIIHCVSYNRRNQILRNSEHRDIMLSHDPQTTRSTIEKFKRMVAPAVLVSPSISTGFDFPYSECRYIIIAKVPFIDKRSLVMQARCASDHDYDMYITAQTLVQMAGRAMRAEDDYCEVLCVDDSLCWFLNKYRHFIPKWFMDSVKWSKTIPKPLEFI